MLISVAICTYQRYKPLATTLVSLEQQAINPTEREILVIDNSPDPEASRRENDRHKAIQGLRWFHLDRPGVAHARNRAVAEAKADKLAFIDDDVTVTPGWLAAVLDGFERFGAAAHSVGGPVRPHWLAPRPDWLAEGMLPFLSLIDRGPTARLLSHDEWIPTANAAFRLDRLREVGGFCETLGRNGNAVTLLSNEDTELLGRLHAAGGHTAWSPGASVLHRIDASRLDQEWFRRRFAWQAISDFMVQPNHHVTHSASNWHEAAQYLEYLQGNAADALSMDHPKPDLCHWQMSAIYHLILGLLSGRSGGDHG
jgi:glycosyltransferase involved in cell wall biosynthesis